MLAARPIPIHSPRMKNTTEQLRNFLQYVAVNMIDNPGSAQLKIAELAPDHMRFKLILAREDVAVLIGRNGSTISALRNLLKAIAKRDNCKVQLHIHSHEEEQQMTASGE